MMNMSSWLDDIERRLMGAPLDRDMDQHLRENEVNLLILHVCLENSYYCVSYRVCKEN
jgi:hypothetical protein